MGQGHRKRMNEGSVTPPISSRSWNSLVLLPGDRCRQSPAHEVSMHLASILHVLRYPPSGKKALLPAINRKRLMGPAGSTDYMKDTSHAASRSLVETARQGRSATSWFPEHDPFDDRGGRFPGFFLRCRCRFRHRFGLRLLGRRWLRCRPRRWRGILRR